MKHGTFSVQILDSCHLDEIFVSYRAHGACCTSSIALWCYAIRASSPLSMLRKGIGGLR